MGLDHQGYLPTFVRVTQRARVLTDWDRGEPRGSSPPLPHHRAYGSVHGGSAESSGMAGGDGCEAEPGMESTTASIDGSCPAAGRSGSARAVRASVPSTPALRASPFAAGSKASSNWMFCRLVRMSVTVLLTLSAVRAFAGEPATMPSADFCAAVTSLADPLSPGLPDTAQTSRGKTDRLHRTPAGSTFPARVFRRICG